MSISGVPLLATHKPWVPVSQKSFVHIKNRTLVKRRALSTDTAVDEIDLDEKLGGEGYDLLKRERNVSASSTDRVRLGDLDVVSIKESVEESEYSEDLKLAEKIADGLNDIVAVDTEQDIFQKEVREGEEQTKTEEDGFGKSFQGSLKGMLMLNVGAALFGSNQVVIKTTEASVSPGALSALRFLIAAAFFTPDMLKGIKNKELRNGALELGVWLFGGYTAQALGLFSTTAARGAFTGTFTVLAVPILVGLSGRRIAPTTWIAALIAIGGVGLLTTSGTEANVGDLWCILSAILFGVHKWRSEETTAKFPDETKELVGLQIWVIMIASCLFCAPEFVATLQENGLDGTLAMAASLPWPALAFMGLGTTALTLFIEMESLKEVSAPLAALIYTAEPLWGALFAYFALGERWGPTGWVGATLIVFSSLLAQLTGDEGSKDKTQQEKVIKYE